MGETVQLPGGSLKNIDQTPLQPLHLLTTMNILLSSDQNPCDISLCWLVNPDPYIGLL